MKKTLLAVMISLSAISVSPFSLAKTVNYNNQELVLSDSISPGDDFYRYVNQDWISKTKIPAGLPYIDSIADLDLKTEQQIQTIIDKLISQPVSALNHNQKNIRNLYLSYLDRDKVEKAGLAPVSKTLATIHSAKTHTDIAKLMATPNFNPIISYWVDLDAKASDTYALHLGQGDLGLPNRNYYLDANPEMESIRKDYIAYISTILTLAGEADPAQKAQQIFDFEKSMAEVHWSPQARRDTIKNYHPMNARKVKNFTKGYDLAILFDHWKLSRKQLAKIIVQNDSAVEKLAKIYANTKVDTLKDFLLFHYLSEKANYLPQAFVDARFNFYSTKLQGIKEQRTLKERAQEALTRLQDMAIAQLYVESYFTADSKAKITDLYNYIKATFHARMKENSWMDAKTRKEALKKLSLFSVKIGYPEKWKDYSTISLKEDTLFDNYVRTISWSQKNKIKRIGQKIRKSEWTYPPHIVNAFYNLAQNEIVFPAAILQPPFFAPDADPAYNYGAIGAVIGHEMGHGFDDQGRNYDGHGSLRDWWTKESKQKFNAKSSNLVKQYNQYSVDGIAVNGQLTLGENIGDLGGMNIALNAYKQFCKEHYPNGEAPIIDGMTGIQRFYIAFAQAFREVATKEAERSQILTDIHSPNQFRANGIVRNMDEWYQAFGVDKKAKLYLPPEERVQIW